MDNKNSVGVVVLLGLGACLIALVTGGYYLVGEFTSLEAERSLTSNLAFFLLINLNIIVVMILGFLVAKNVLKLVLDRRRNILGARLRSRLVAAFVGLSLIPTVLLFLVARGMMERGMQEWFSPQISAAVDGALDVAHYHYETEEARVYRQLRQMAGHISELHAQLTTAHLDDRVDRREKINEVLRLYLSKKREEYGLFEVAIVATDGRRIVRARSVEAGGSLVEEPDIHLAALDEAKDGVTVVRAEQSLNGEFLRGYAPIRSGVLDGIVAGAAQVEAAPGGGGADADSLAQAQATMDFVLVGTRWVLPELSTALGKVVNAFEDHREFKTYRRPLASSYFLTLVVVTLLIVFAAIWVGFYLARDLSVPIGLLAEGTEQVANGNLEHRIPEVGDDELSVLVRSFNTMTHDLNETTTELDSRRRYMETILAGVGVGVLAIDTDGVVTTINTGARTIVGIPREETVLGRNFEDVLPEPLSDSIGDAMSEIHSPHSTVHSKDVCLDLQYGSKHVQLTLTDLRDEEDKALGVVVLIDDLTELVSAQRMAAWQEVARRIAHEIKNPLTPIQLCAERIQRKFVTSIEGADKYLLTGRDQDVLREATDIIVSQVSNLRTLVNEFSEFARMPKSELKPDDINEVIKATMALYSETHTDISFEAELDESIPSFSMDRDQLGRALINLIDNAISSVRQYRESLPPVRDTGTSATQKAIRSVANFFSSPSLQKQEGVVQVATAYDPALRLVTLRVSDNGLGIPDPDKAKLFEPYFSTKRGGTGLGLAIVNTIVRDHNGFIRVRDVSPQGASFIIELPLIIESVRKRA